MGKYVSWRTVQDFILGGLATYGAIWLLAESIGEFFDSFAPKGWLSYGVILAVAATGGAWRAWPKRRIEFQIPGTDSTVEMRFGDIFACDGIAVISVNEYFDGELGDHVSENSLHGGFIKDVLGGQSSAFFELTSRALKAVVPKEVAVARSSGRCDRYAIGTYARVDVNDRRYLLTVLAHTDLETLKAWATIHDLWACLSGVWEGIRAHSNGMPVSVPLIGSGLSGTGLPPGELIQVIVTSFLCHTKERKIADRVSLVLPHHLVGKVDLNSVKRSWT